MFELKPGEQLDDLQDRGFMMIQNPNDYCFTSDAVLLANFAKAKNTETVCDLCSGSGIVPTLMYLKHIFKKAYLIEINPDACDRAVRSLKGNNITNFEVLNMKIQDVGKVITPKTIDVVTVNPPYLEAGVGEIEENRNIAIARREIELCLEDIIKKSSELLKYGGRFYMINSTSRLTDVVYFMRKYNIEPKIIQFIYPKQEREANVFLVEGKMNGAKGVRILKPIIVHN